MTWGIWGLRTASDDEDYTWDSYDLPSLWNDYHSWWAGEEGDPEDSKQSIQNWKNVETYLHENHGLPDAGYDKTVRNTASDPDWEHYYNHPATLGMAKLHSLAQGKNTFDGNLNSSETFKDDDVLQGAALGLLKIRRDQHNQIRTENGYYPTTTAAIERDVAEDLARLAGKFGDLPEGLTFTHGKDYTGRDVVNAHLGDKHVGQLTWTNSDKWGHDINYITVHPEYRRRGVGTAILHHIRENIDPKITHSTNVTPAGRGFAKSDGFKPPPYYNGEKGRFEMDPVRDDSNEWPDAAVGNGMKWDDNFWKGKNKDRFARIAMPAPLPQGVHFRYHPELVWSPGVTAHYQGKQIGSLEWYDDDHVMVDLGSRKPGEIDRISVHPDHQGNSVATSMFDFAKQYEPRLHHSEQLTDDGRGWSEYEKARNARLAAVNQDLVDRLHGEFGHWWGENGDMACSSGVAIGHWPSIEKFLKDKYPVAHRGLSMGMEEAQPLIDQTPHGLYGDRMPQGHDPYQTGSGAEAEYGYDPKEIASGMLLLHNRSYGLGRMDMQETDENRLNDIAQKRYQMQRDYENRTAGINGDPPPMTYEPFNTPWTNGIMARHAEDGRPLGHLHWYPDGEIETIRVHPEMRGRDIAKHMLTHAATHPETYEAEDGIQPSNHLTPEGRAFARSMGHNPSDAEVTHAEGENEWAWKAVDNYVPMRIPYNGQNEAQMSKYLDQPWTPTKTASSGDGWPVWWRGRQRPAMPFDKRWHPNHPDHVPAPWDN